VHGGAVLTSSAPSASRLATTLALHPAGDTDCLPVNKKQPDIVHFLFISHFKLKVRDCLFLGKSVSCLIKKQYHQLIPYRYQKQKRVVVVVMVEDDVSLVMFAVCHVCVYKQKAPGLTRSS
jgi:hypothetical protein